MGQLIVAEARRDSLGDSTASSHWRFGRLLDMQGKYDMGVVWVLA